jgi:hypothetical protein
MLSSEYHAGPIRDLCSAVHNKGLAQVRVNFTVKPVLVTNMMYIQQFTYHLFVYLCCCANNLYTQNLKKMTE